MAFIDQLNTLNSSDIIGYFPHLESVHNFYLSINDPKATPQSIYEQLGFSDPTIVARGIIALLVELENADVENAIKLLHIFIFQNKPELYSTAFQIGEPGEPLLKYFQ
jgi:hypothetical protein